MSGFIEECRREWKRLGVPDAIANEMAADLAADLEEAESEGAAPEEVLGNGVFDPRSFAASWAAERGVVRQPVARGPVVAKTLTLAAIGALLVMAAVGAALVVVSRTDATAVRLAVAAPRPPVELFRRPGFGPTVRFGRGGAHASVVVPWRARGGVVVLPQVVGPPGGFAVGLVRRDNTSSVGWALLIAGLAGTAFVVLFSAWLDRRPRYSGGDFGLH